MATTVHSNSTAPLTKVTTSPALTSRDGFTRSPLTCTLPPVSAWAATERDLNRRTPKSLRSMRAAPGPSSGRFSDMAASIIERMKQALFERLRADLQGLRTQGLYKSERVLGGPQGGGVRTDDQEVVNLCANNYLGLANHPSVREAAHHAHKHFGYGMASVRFICGTQSVLKQLEERLSRFGGGGGTSRGAAGGGA